MSFIDQIEKEISMLERELLKTRRARIDKNHHSRFVTEAINSLIREGSKENPDSPVTVLGDALSKVSDLISNSFDKVDQIESNIIVAINASNKIKDMYVAYENKKKQEAPVKKEKTGSIRKIGKKPKDSLEKRKRKLKNSSAKKSKDKN